MKALLTILTLIAGMHLQGMSHKKDTAKERKMNKLRAQILTEKLSFNRRRASQIFTAL